MLRPAASPPPADSGIIHTLSRFPSYSARHIALDQSVSMHHGAHPCPSPLLPNLRPKMVNICGCNEVTMGV
jgi:hypothetical protein